MVTGRNDNDNRSRRKGPFESPLSVTHNRMWAGGGVWRLDCTLNAMSSNQGHQRNSLFNLWQTKADNIRAVAFSFPQTLVLVQQYGSSTLSALNSVINHFLKNIGEPRASVMKINNTIAC